MVAVCNGLLEGRRKEIAVFIYSWFAEPVFSLNLLMSTATVPPTQAATPYSGSSRMTTLHRWQDILSEKAQTNTINNQE